MGSQVSTFKTRTRNFTMRKKKEKVTFRKNQAEVFELTMEEVKQIKLLFHFETYEKGPKYPGDKITERMIFQCGKSRSVFQEYHECAARDRNRQQPHSTSEHYQKLSGALRLVISNLDKPGTAGELAQNIGAQHIRYVSHGFTSSMFSTFGEALMHESAMWPSLQRRSKRYKRNFLNVVLFLVEQMKLGFEQTLANSESTNVRADAMTISQLHELPFRSSPEPATMRKRSATFT